ncbi:MAG: hypothetical protein V1770_00705 [bacterium]
MKNKKFKIIGSGFSLIEILIAITFLTVGIFSVASMFPTGIKMSRTAEEKTLAATIAQEKMEELIASGYEGIAIGIIEPRHEAVQGSYGDIYNFYRETATAYVDEDLSPSESDTGMKKIEVTIFWNAIDGTEKNITLRRLISRR